MVKALKKRATHQPPPKSFRWWRGILGATLTAFVIVPYLMGTDIERYLKNWIGAINDSHENLRLELVHYERHWFTSNGDITISGGLIHEPITIHIHAYHGPLLFNANYYPRFGLTLLTGTIDPEQLLQQPSAIKLNGLIQLHAFIPYFSDREIRANLPGITITDKANGLIYTIQSLAGNFDGDSLVQLETPSLKITRLNGSNVADINSGLFRILPGNQTALAMNEILIYQEKDNPAVIQGLMMEGDASNIAQDVGFNLNIHFNHFNPAPADPDAFQVGPLEFKLKVSGLNHEGLTALGDLFKMLGLEKNNLTPEEALKLSQALSHTISAQTLFELTTELTTPKGPVSAQLQGGFSAKAIQEVADFVDAFYSKGTVTLANSLMEALKEHYPDRASLLLNVLKKKDDVYAMQIDIKDSSIIINGKNVKDE